MSTDSLINISRLNSNFFTIDESLLNSTHFKVDDETIKKYKSIEGELKDIFDFLDNNKGIDDDDDDNEEEETDKPPKPDVSYDIIYSSLAKICNKLDLYNKLNYDLLVQIIDDDKLKNL